LFHQIKDKSYIAKHLALPSEARNMKVKNRLPVSSTASSGRWSKRADGEWGFDLDDPVEGNMLVQASDDDTDDEETVGSNAAQQNTIQPQVDLEKKIIPAADAVVSSTSTSASNNNNLTVTQKPDTTEGAVADAGARASESATTEATVASGDEQPPIHLVLRMRDEKKELQDIKFDFFDKKDTVGEISHELVNAKLIDTSDMIAVSANLNKLLDNHSLSPITFQLVSLRFILNTLLIIYFIKLLFFCFSKNQKEIKCCSK
jgi:hypothetical protein